MKENIEIHEGRRHRLPLQEIFVSLGLKSGRTLFERLRKKGWSFKTQFTHVVTHFLSLVSKTKIKF